jgi:ABC-2 type transport system ATP-binding protein
VAEDVVLASGLTKHYRGKPTPAVDGVSFAISAGETVGLLGPNGAGKTTLMKMICGVTPPSAGEIRVFGHDPVREPVAAKSRIGAMHQSGPYDEMLSGLDNLRIAARFRGLTWAAAEPWAREVAEYLGLTDALNRLVFQLSGGQRQRLQLVRALLTLPRLLILDEPSAGLDVAGRHQVERFVRWLRREHGVTVLWTSHHIEEIERNCQRVLVIRAGRVLRFAEPRALIREYGGSRLVVTTEDQVAAKIVAEWADAAGHPATVDGTEVRLDGATAGDVLAPLAAYCRTNGVAITGCSTAADSLEQVFLRMTEKEPV